MQAVVLAGGLGTRLWPITTEIPKPMVPVAGVPYLEHQLRLFQRQGITDVVLLTGYLGEQIEDYFGTGEASGLKLRYARETTPQGTAGALRDAGALLADFFLLIYGDSYLPIDYASVGAALSAAPICGVVVVYDNRDDTTVRNNIALEPDGSVCRYAKDAAPDASLKYVDAGVLAFRKTLLSWIPARGKVSLEKEVFPELIAQRELRAYVTRQRFYDIGTPERLQVIERLLNS